MLFLLIEIATFWAWMNFFTVENHLWRLWEGCSSSLSECLLKAFVMTVVQITVVTVCTAWCGWYGFWQVAGAMAVITGIILLFGYSLSKKILYSYGWGTNRYNLWRFTRGVNQLLDSPYAVAVSVLSAFSVGMVIWYGLRLPAMQYDVYHVVRGVLMMQEGHLPPFGWDSMGVDYYPGNMDMLYAWRILGTGSDAWTANVQLYFGLAGCLAIYGISRNLIMASRETSFIVAMTLFSMTTVIHHSWMALTDLGAAGMYWCAVGLACSRRLTVWDVVLCAVASGWAVGAKTSLAYWVVGLTIFVIWRIWNNDD